MDYGMYGLWYVWTMFMPYGMYALCNYMYALYLCLWMKMLRLWMIRDYLWLHVVTCDYL